MTLLGSVSPCEKRTATMRSLIPILGLDSLTSVLHSQRSIVFPRRKQPALMSADFKHLRHGGQYGIQ